MSVNKENMMEEWKSLRNEIARKQDFVERLVLTTATGNLVIYSFAFSLQELAPMNAFIALLPIFLTTITYFWILRNLHSALRIVKYIKEKIDPNTGIGWENWIQQSRRVAQPKGRIRVNENVFSLFYHFFLVVSLLVSITSVWAPHWPYGNNASLIRNIPVNMSVWITIFIILFWILWYILARFLWIGRRIDDIETINQTLQVE